MPNIHQYASSKIYKIVSKTSDKIYLGSTLSTITLKKSQIKKEYKEFEAGKRKEPIYSEIVKDPNFKVILVEEYPCKNKDQLNNRLDEWIDENECLNKTEDRIVQKPLNVPSKKKVRFADDKSSPVDIPDSCVFLGDVTDSEDEEDMDIDTVVNDDDITDDDISSDIELELEED